MPGSRAVQAVRRRAGRRREAAPFQRARRRQVLQSAIPDWFLKEAAVRAGGNPGARLVRVDAESPLPAEAAKAAVMHKLVNAHIIAWKRLHYVTKPRQILLIFNLLARPGNSWVPRPRIAVELSIRAGRTARSFDVGRSIEARHHSVQRPLDVIRRKKERTTTGNQREPTKTRQTPPGKTDFEKNNLPARFQ